jgi:hypothetical protein
MVAQGRHAAALGRRDSDAEGRLIKLQTSDGESPAVSAGLFLRVGARRAWIYNRAAYLTGRAEALDKLAAFVVGLAEPRVVAFAARLKGAPIILCGEPGGFGRAFLRAGRPGRPIFPAELMESVGWTVFAVANRQREVYDHLCLGRHRASVNGAIAVC